MGCFSVFGRPWPNGIIPYVLPEDHEFKALILAAIEEINSKTNVRFIPRSSEDQKYYVNFICNKALNYNSAPVGYIECSSGGSVSVVNINHNKRVLHELGHVVGMEHEHQRYDRDEHIEFIYENIDENHHLWKHNVLPKIKETYTDMSCLTCYDIHSCMHYWCCICAKTAPAADTKGEKASHEEEEEEDSGDDEQPNKKPPTMRYKKDPNLFFVTPEVLSPLDIECINKAYPHAPVMNASG